MIPGIGLPKERIYVDGHERFTEATLRSTRARVLGARPGPLSPSRDALLDRGPPRGVQARYERVRPRLRNADRRARDGLRQRLRLQGRRPDSGAGGAEALRARGGGPPD